MEVLRVGSRGSAVMKLQAILRKIGYNLGAIDGVFGNQTRDAVMQFQGNNGLTPDGVVGANTYNALRKFYLGYVTYTIRMGDTLYSIARRHFTSIARILGANPNLRPQNLMIGQRITVPYGIDVVDTNINYTYEVLENDIQGLKARYPFIEVGVAGNSVLGKNLYYIKLGSGENQVFYNGAHHGLEWITVPVLMKFIEDFSEAYVDGTSIRGYDIREIWNTSSIYIIPMVNPDGVDLVLNGLERDNPYYSRLIQWNNGSTNFSRVWQANIRGVDLNHNYDASWNLSKAAEREYGITGPGPTRYSGPSPESEPESKAVADFTRNNNFRLVMAYHSQGEVIYWTYLNIVPPDSRRIGELFSRVSGYVLAETTGISSYAGYKDWFIGEFRRPGYTIEVGRGRNPLPISQFNEIYNDNIEILILAAIV